MRSSLLVCFLALSAALLASSCATTKSFTVQVDSIGSNVYPAEKTYIVVPTDKDIGAEDLRFKEYAGYLKKILSKKGYREVSSSDEANIIVYFMYGVGDPELRTYAYSVPIYGQIGVTVTPSPGQPQGPAVPPAGTQKKPPFEHYSPIYGIVGSKTEYQNYITYFRYCKIEAFDLKLLKESNTEQQLWSTIITSRGTSDDLRLVMPYLLAAAEDYIGVDTGTKVEVIIGEKDARVTSLK